MIAAGEPEGVIRAAAGWGDLAAGADVNPIVRNLMAYANEDPAGVRALSALALRDDARGALRQNAAYALRAIHTKETLPALIALLDDHDDRVQPYALSGLCLFVRNAPAVTLGSPCPRCRGSSPGSPPRFSRPRHNRTACSAARSIRPTRIAT